MNDLIRWMCLYAQERRMDGLWSDPEYRACNQVSTACIEALEEQLDGEGRKAAAGAAGPDGLPERPGAGVSLPGGPVRGLGTGGTAAARSVTACAVTVPLLGEP